MHFVRLLRAVGLPVGPAKVIDAVAAVDAMGVATATDFREALAAVLVSRHEHLVLFERRSICSGAIRSCWNGWSRRCCRACKGRDGRRCRHRTCRPLAQAMLAVLQPKSSSMKPRKPTTTPLSPSSARGSDSGKDFATLSADELAHLPADARPPATAAARRPPRRAQPASPARAWTCGRPATHDGAAGAVAPLAFRTRVRRPPPLVVLCDISGSMDRYARMLLHFLHAVTKMDNVCKRWCSARGSPISPGILRTATSMSRWPA